LGSLRVVFAEIEAIRQGAPGQALIWYARDYHKVGRAADAA
jgi:hypothetical protein